MSAPHRDAYRKDDPDRRFLQGRLWREKLRPRQLAKQPLCAHCQALGLVTAAAEVDHVKRPRGDRLLQTSEANFQSLCKPCHLRKSAWERAATGKPLKLGVALDGWPIELHGGRVQRENERA